MSNHRVTERISLNHPVGVNHQSTLSTKSKLMKINSILCGKVEGSGKEMMNEVENNYYRKFVPKDRPISFQNTKTI